MDLRGLIQSGYRIHIRGMMEIGNAPISADIKEEILEHTKGLATHIVFLSFSRGEKGLIYPICSPDEWEYAQEEILKGKEIVGFHLRITCAVKSLNIGGGLVLDPVCESLKEIIKTSIEIKEEDNTFDIFHEVNSSDRKEGEDFIATLETALFTASIKNKVQFEMINIQWGAKFAAQPISIWTGLQETLSQKVNSSDQGKVESCLQDSMKRKILSGLVNYYGQVTEASKLIVGFNLLTDLSKSEKVEHMLTESQKNVLFKMIGEIGEINDEQKEALKKGLENADNYPKHTRNKRVAKYIASLLGKDEEVIYKAIGRISKLRAKAAHSNENDFKNEWKRELKEAFVFIETVVFEYLDL